MMDEVAENQAPEKTSKKPSSKLRSNMLLVAVVMVFAIIVHTFLIASFFIPSGSMLPTLKINDHILVSKVSLQIMGVKRGDIVVFNRTPSDKDTSANILVKRVIGLPGETISAKNGVVYIDGKKLTESYLPPNDTTSNFPLTHIPANDYFMMGDNRGNSYDSRFFGTVPKPYFIGQVILTYFPINHIKLF
jgi:signal peptidase I